LKGGRVTIPRKVMEKLSVKEDDFLTYLETCNRSIKIKKLEFGWNEEFKQIEKLKREIIVKLTESIFSKPSIYSYF